MKTKFTALALATATALSLLPKPAMAGDRELALVGGFLGGLIVASAINDSRHDDSYYSHDYATVVANDRCDEGYWRDVAVQVWVPNCWIVERNNYGHNVRRYVSGHYERRTNRVWVASSHHERRDRSGRNGREISSGSGRDRR